MSALCHTVICEGQRKTPRNYTINLNTLNWNYGQIRKGRWFNEELSGRSILEVGNGRYEVIGRKYIWNIDKLYTIRMSVDKAKRGKWTIFFIQQPSVVRYDLPYFGSFFAYSFQQAAHNGVARLPHAVVIDHRADG